MPQPVLARWDEMIERPHGILLVTGPTGSGQVDDAVRLAEPHRER
jgi:type II secretory ATPase GspE/PulE/Tfp pilus assembly ATPase PilB-like protein